MERTYDLNQQELLKVTQLQQESQQLLARYGAATLELKTVEPALDRLQQQQRDLISAALNRHGIQNFQSARLEGDHLVARLADELPALSELLAPAGSRPNGEDRTAKE